MKISKTKTIYTLLLTLMERKTSCLQNALILGIHMSQDTRIGGPTPYNPSLGHQCPMVIKGLMLKS